MREEVRVTIMRRGEGDHHEGGDHHDSMYEGDHYNFTQVCLPFPNCM